MQRRGGGVYYIRRVVPKDLQTFMRRREIAQSLRTTDFELAKRRCRAQNVALDHMFDEQRKAMQAACGVPLAREVGLERITQQQADRMALGAHEAAEWDAREHQDDEDNPLALPYAAWVPQQAVRDRAIRRADWEEWRQHARLSILDLFEQYAAQPGLGAGTVVQWRGYIKHLIGFLGHDNALQLNAADLRRWRNHLAEDALPNGQVRRAKTINDSYLASVRAVLGWALDKDLVTSNVAATVKPLRSERVTITRERDLTRAEQSTILAATLTPPSPKLGRYKAVTRRWVPWLCAYTGARVGEITQARKEDIQQVDGVWCINITPEAGSIKSSKARIVPLHAHLVEQGFIQFVQQSDGPLFYQPRLNDDSKKRPRSKIAANKLADWVRSIGVEEVPQPNHSWRHTFKTLSRSLGIPEGAADYIQGHAPANDSRAYGSHDLAALAREIAKLPRFQP